MRSGFIDVVSKRVWFLQVGKSFSLDGQTRWTKLSTLPVNLPSAQPLMKCLWGAEFLPQISIFHAVPFKVMISKATRYWYHRTTKLYIVKEKDLELNSCSETFLVCWVDADDSWLQKQNRDGYKVVVRPHSSMDIALNQPEIHVYSAH